tara:strand:- start:56 stop:286 length:231 start_codon:yes stop_codon:yes gene_type:complete
MEKQKYLVDTLRRLIKNNLWDLYQSKMEYVVNHETKSGENYHWIKGQQEVMGDIITLLENVIEQNQHIINENGGVQ